MIAPSTTISITTGAKTPMTFTGRSRAGEATAFNLPQVHWMLDAGAVVAGQAAHCIFITHTHADHVQCLPQLLSKLPAGGSTGNKQQQQPIQVYLPKVAVPLVQAFLQAHQAMVECHEEPDKVPVPFELIPVEPGDEWIVYGGRKRGTTEFVVKAVECFHRVPCVGYSFVRRRAGPLLPEYAALPGLEIGRLKKQGVVVQGTLEEPVLLFLGDTTHQVFDQNPEMLLLHRTILVECTFLEDDEATLARADHTKHMNWKHLKLVIEAHPDKLFLLSHFSLKYSVLFLRRFFADSRNVHPMLLQSEIDAVWHKQSDKNPATETEPPVCRCFQCQPTQLAASAIDEDSAKGLG